MSSVRQPTPIGQRFNYLIVVGEAPPKRGANGKARRCWLCVCDCGVEKSIEAGNVRCGGVKSCGCKHGTPEHVWSTHGQSKSSTYTSWSSMRNRCNNPNGQNYDRYGARGIRVSPRWDSFETFLADMGERPPGTTLERINNDGNYEPGNCRWATRAEQSLNTSQCVRMTAFGETKTVTEWARDPRCIVGADTVWSRLGRGWSMERCLVEPAAATKRWPKQPLTERHLLAESADAEGSA